MARILIVDDIPEVRLQLRNVLNTFGHEIHEASDGVEGLNKARSLRDIDLILTDLHMPNKGGLEMCEEIKQNSFHKRTPIVMLTTESSSSLIARGRNIGIVMWLLKPLEPNLLIKSINQILEGEIQIGNDGTMDYGDAEDLFSHIDDAANAGSADSNDARSDTADRDVPDYLKSGLNSEVKENDGSKQPPAEKESGKDLFSRLFKRKKGT
ncbi:MAG: response regulator [Oligoflexales bacterium]|nr:response regulator [Oligoflexales bacterium]